MKDKLKRFTKVIFFETIGLFLFVSFLFLVRALVMTRVVILQVIAVILTLGLFVSGIAGAVFLIAGAIQKCITKKAAAVLDPDELQQ